MTHGRARVSWIAQRSGDVLWAGRALSVRHGRGYDAATGRRDNQGDCERCVDVPVAVGSPVRVVIERGSVTPTSDGSLPTPPIPAGAPGPRVHGDPS